MRKSDNELYKFFPKQIEDGSELYNFYRRQISDELRSLAQDGSCIYIARQRLSHPVNQQENPAFILLTRAEDKLALFAIEAPFNYGDSGLIYSGRNLRSRTRVAVKSIGREIARGWVALSKIDHPNLIKIHAYGTDHSSEKKRSYLIMEKGGCKLQNLFDQRSSISFKQMLTLSVDMLEIFIALAENKIRWEDINPDSFIMDSNSRHIKLCDFDHFSFAPDYYAQNKISLNLVRFLWGYLCSIHFLSARYRGDEQRYLEGISSYEAHAETYLNPEHLPLVKKSTAAIDQIYNQAVEYLKNTFISPDTLPAIREDYKRTISGLLKRLEFQRLKYRSPHLDEAVINAFIDLCDLLDSMPLNVEKLRLLLKQIPVYLMQCEGGAIMDILRDIDLAGFIEVEETKEVLRLVLSLIQPDESGRNIPGQYYNNLYVQQYYPEISQMLADEEKSEAGCTPFSSLNS